MSYYRWQGDTLLLLCHLQPNAGSSEFAGEHGGRLKIRIAAAPVDNRANTELIALLARRFGVAKQAVSIVAGGSGRRKTVAISKPAQLPAALAIAPPGATL
jgi:uncharacterized protein (TIGR00251 family)